MGGAAAMLQLTINTPEATSQAGTKLALWMQGTYIIIADKLE